MKSVIFFMTLLISMTPVYAAKTSHTKEMPIYVAKQIEETPSKRVEQADKQIWAHVTDYEGEKLQELVEEIGTREGEVYLSLYGENSQEQSQVKVIYDALIAEDELIQAPNLELHLVYTPLDEKDTLFKDMAYIEALNIRVQKVEDQRLIKYFNDHYGKQYTLIVTDELAGSYGQDLSSGLDAIAKVYYDLPFEYGEVDKVFRQSKLGPLPVKYSTFYNELEGILEVDYEPLIFDEVLEPLQFMVRTDEPIEYIEYKVNDEPAGQSFRYPYPITIDGGLLHKGINEVRVIMKMKGQEQYQVKNFYIHLNKEGIYQERAARKAEVYPKNQQPSYKKLSTKPNSANKVYIPTLMYHKIKDKVENTEEDQSMTVSTKLFEEQVKVLLEAGYTPINFKQLQDYLEGRAGLPKQPILITADDGYLCNYTKAYPILKKYNAQATFFVTSLYVGVTNENEHFTWQQAKEMEDSGLIDIQSHTHGHTLMNELNENDVRYEVQKSFADIEKYLGKRDVKVLAYPQFLHTTKVKEWVKSCDVDLQVTNLAPKYGREATQPVDIKRIHVSNEMSPQALLKAIK